MAARPPPAPPARALLLALAGALLAPRAARGKWPSPGGGSPASPLGTRPPGAPRALLGRGGCGYTQGRMAARGDSAAERQDSGTRLGGDPSRSPPTHRPGASSQGEEGTPGLGPRSRLRAEPGGTALGPLARLPLPGLICQGVFPP